MPRNLACSIVLLMLVLSGRAITDDRPRPLPISAHNCYSENRADNPRLAEALALGIDNIEIDLGWDDAAKRLIIGHDESPRPGVAYPGLEDSLIPALESHFKAPRPDGAPTLLTIDWKTNRPEAVRQFKDVLLDARPDWFSSAPKAPSSPLTARRLTVCFSGGEAAKDAYDALIPAGGEYRAFRDRVIGAGTKYEEDVVAYIPDSSTPYLRFLAFYWGAVERGGPTLAGDWTPSNAKRLTDLTTLAHRRGFRIRFYSLNGRTGILGGYRFTNEEAARVRWKAAAGAGVDWVAGDEYREMVEALRAIPADAPQGGKRLKPSTISRDPVSAAEARS